jgi:hypothetical protein
MPTRRRTGEYAALFPDDSPRLRELLTEIAQRLRPVCRHMPEADFDAMVRKAAEATLRAETRAGRIGHKDDPAD